MPDLTNLSNILTSSSGLLDQLRNQILAAIEEVQLLQEDDTLPSARITLSLEWTNDEGDQKHLIHSLTLQEAVNLVS